MKEGFDEDALIVDAMAVDGLSDFGDEKFREPLRVLLASLSTANLSGLGAMLLRSQVMRSLANLLRTQYWWERYPEIGNEIITSPLIVLGMMRSGTTLIQRLLAQDPCSACVLGWEAMEPAPRLGFKPSIVDPRIVSAEKREAQSREFAPRLFAIHPSYAHEAEEEIMILNDAFLSHVPESYCNLPLYRHWLDEQDFSPAYRHLYRTLQLLQWSKKLRGETCERWVLKTPAHLGYMELLLETFPDAHIVHMHRDPLDTIPSGASLNATLWQMHQDTVDNVEVGRQWLQRMVWSTERAMRYRELIGPGSANITDIEFIDSIRDPLQQIGKIYREAGIAFTGEAELSMRAWLAKDGHAELMPHKYTAENFGLSVRQIEQAFETYTSRYLQKYH